MSRRRVLVVAALAVALAVGGIWLGDIVTGIDGMDIPFTYVDADMMEGLVGSRAPGENVAAARSASRSRWRRGRRRSSGARRGAIGQPRDVVFGIAEHGT